MLFMRSCCGILTAHAYSYTVHQLPLRPNVLRPRLVCTEEHRFAETQAIHQTNANLSGEACCALFRRKKKENTKMRNVEFKWWKLMSVNLSKAEPLRFWRMEKPKMPNKCSIFQGILLEVFFFVVIFYLWLLLITINLTCFLVCNIKQKTYLQTKLKALNREVNIIFSLKVLLLRSHDQPNNTHFSHFTVGPWEALAQKKEKIVSLVCNLICD